jgi:hypothetical protein
MVDAPNVGTRGALGPCRSTIGSHNGSAGSLGPSKESFFVGIPAGSPLEYLPTIGYPGRQPHRFTMRAPGALAATVSAAFKPLILNEKRLWRGRVVFVQQGSEKRAGAG